MDAYATGLSFPWLSSYKRHTPRPNLDASTCKITDLEELKVHETHFTAGAVLQILENGFMALCPLK